MKTWVLILAAASTAGGCKWSEFDDIKDEAVVSSTGRPDNGSTIWGVGLLPGTSQGADEAGVLGVFGVSEPIYNEVVYSAAGGAKIGDRSVEFGDLGFASINVDPIIVSNADSDDIAIIGVPGNNGVAFHGHSSTIDYTMLNDSITPDAATYIHPGATSQDAPILVVADDDLLYGIGAGGTAVRCHLVTTDASIVGTPRVRAMGAIRATGGADELVLWLDDGHILLLPNDVVVAGSTNCPSGSTVEPTVLADKTAFLPMAGSKILDLRALGSGNVGSQDVVFFGRGENGASLQLFHTSAVHTLTAVGAASPVDRATSVAILRTDDASYVVVGLPMATVENVPAGQVKLFAVDPTTGVDGSAMLVLNDAQPEEDQQYGRAVTAIKYNGHEVLAVAADNEVYLYYRTELYDETRVRGQ